MTDEAIGVTAELVAWARRLRYEDLPESVVEVAKHCVLDWLGVTLAGSREPLSGILRRQVSGNGDAGVSLVGCDERRPPLQAALINGAAGHALDFDDTHTTLSGHPTVPVLPAVLAVAERDGRSGRDLLAAFVVGVEVECRVGALVNPRHYELGFHATGTLGTLGAAAAVAHLLDLDDAAWRCALGLAGTQAAGLKSAFGTMAKPLHAGKAASDGLLAALLAADGFSASTTILEAEQGLAATLGGGAPAVGRLAALGDRFSILDTLFKYHAACYLTHSAIESALELRPEVESALGRLAAVEVEVSPASLRVCNIERPATGLEGKFSLRTTTAMALLGDETSDLAAFSDRRMLEPQLVELRDRVLVRPVAGVSPTCSRVRIALDDRTLEASVDVGIPAADLGRQWQRLSDKFTALARPLVGERGAVELRDRVAALELAPCIEPLLSVVRLTPVPVARSG